MENVTNNLNNAGRHLKDQQFHLKLSYGELLKLRALAKDVPPQWAQNSQMVSALSKVYEELNEIVKKIEDRNLS
jgi:hypothetical protein